MKILNMIRTAVKGAKKMEPLVQVPVGTVSQGLVTMTYNPNSKMKVFKVLSGRSMSSFPIASVAIPGKQSKNYGKIILANYYKGKIQQKTILEATVNKEGIGQFSRFTTYHRNDAGKMEMGISQNIDQNISGNINVDLNTVRFGIGKNGRFAGFKAGENGGTILGIQANFSSQGIQVGDQPLQALQRGPIPPLPTQTFEFDGHALNWGRVLD